MDKKFNKGDRVQVNLKAFITFYGDKNDWTVDGYDFTNTIPMVRCYRTADKNHNTSFLFREAELDPYPKCYRVDYTYVHPDMNSYIDDEYIFAQTDEEAIEQAKAYCNETTTFVDVEGEVKRELVSVTLVDDTQETYPDIKTIYY